MRSFRTALAGLPLIALAWTLPASAQQSAGGFVQFNEDPSNVLARHLRTLTASPRSFDALLGAGRAALQVGDAQAAVGFFARAEEISPQNGRVKAGLGSAFVMLNQPAAALRYFADAARLGIGEAEIAGDRGLAQDLRGETRAAQRDYGLALRRGGEDAETVRRLALSYAIAGDRKAALATLDPLLRGKDAAAWRARAFVLALTGDAGGATRAAEAAMPQATAAAFTPYFRKMADLRPGEKAAAVHFGHFPGDGRPVSMADLFGQGEVAARVALESIQRPVSATDAGRIDRDQVALGSRRTPPPVASFPGASSPGASSQVPARVTTSPVRETVRIAVAPPPAPAPRPANVPRIARRDTGEARVSTSATLSERYGMSRGARALPKREDDKPKPAPVPSPAPARSLSTAPSPAPASAPVVTGAPAPAPAPSGTAPASTRLAEVAAEVRAASASPTPPPPVLDARAIGGTPAQATPTAVGAAPQTAPQAAPQSAPQSLLPTVLTTAPADPPPAGATGALVGPPAPAPEATFVLTPAPTPAPIIIATAPPAQSPPLRTETAGTAAASSPAPNSAAPRSEPKVEPRAEAKAPPPPKPKVETAARKSAPKVETAPAGAPARHWVQLATGANEAALAATYRRFKAKAPDLLGDTVAWTVPVAATNRVLVGPFATGKEAQELVNKLKPKGIDALAWSSAKGQEIKKLGAK